MTECIREQLEFHGLGRRRVSARFDGGQISSDGGGTLLREADLRIGLSERLGGCFHDHRNPNSVEHDVRTLVAQRVYGVALGYEDLNDHDVLRSDSVLAMLVGKDDVTGSDRVREQDRGRPLASSSTLNRLELSEPDAAAHSRYKRIGADAEAIDGLLVDLFIESYSKAPREIWLDLDATDDPLHGHQEGRFFHGYYGCYCYLPLYIFCGEHLLCARLRASNIDAAAGSEEELERIVGRIRERWPGTRIHIRGDSGFCREWLMHWCEANDIGYVLGLARNSRLVRMLGERMNEAREAHGHTGKRARRFGDFRYRTRKSWSRSRRVVGKAEYLAKGANPRFIVTNLSGKRFAAKRLYERIYCARGEMENRIKEQQLGLFADRTSSTVMRANQLRLYFSSFAYVLLHAVRRIGAAGTEFARAQCTTLRLKLLKIGVRIKVSVRRVWLSYAQNYPYAEAFVQVLENLQRQALWRGSG
ncbi:MAG: IS1380 family transposase [Gammaproteobacteria bacterium]|nr:IS1380 family transposase [Pseudomonadales bacterium]NIW85406.1 IS1380 family transposase [Gammaproteobacteria bacterium]NIX08218.1 IS1380 family transposase [Pseudomonadales bacterium]